MYSFTSNLSKEEYDKFVENYSMASFMQEYNWANIKDNWDKFHCGLYKEKKLVGVCSILVKKIFKGIKLFYIPRGYLIDFTNYDDLKAMTDNIKRLAKENNAYVVKIDPNFCISDNSFKEEEIEHIYSKNYESKHKNLLKCGFKWLGISKDMHETFQPQYNIFAPMCDETGNCIDIAKVLKKYNRIKSYFGLYQEKRGISFEITDKIEKVDTLAYLLEQTEKKQGINLRNKEYYLKILKNFKNRAFMIFATINIDIYLNYLKETNSDVDLINQIENLKKDKGNYIPLSGALFLLPANKKGIKTSEYLYAGNNIILNNLHASAALVFEIIKFSLEKGCSYCNLGGVDGKLNDNLTHFKRNFNGRIMEFAGEYDLPTSKLYYPIKIFYPLLIKIYKKLK